MKIIDGKINIIEIGFQNTTKASIPYIEGGIEQYES